jgi:4-amino-4-deoxy-L-arabinose transferase-like glycosyltransferase
MSFAGAMARHFTRYSYLWTLLGLTLLAALPRLYQLGAASMWNDEGSSSLFALGILNTGLPIIPGRPEALPAVDFETFYSYLEALSFRLLGISNESARLPSALAGIFLVPASYMLGSRVRDRATGITLATLITFSTELIAWSRQAREYALLALVVVLTFLVLERLSRSTGARERFGWIGLSLLLAGIAATSDLGLFLLYMPGAILGLVVFHSFAHPELIPSFFGFHNGFGSPWDRSNLRKHRTRRWLFLSGCLTAITIVAFPPKALAAPAASFFRAVLSSSPYTFTLTPFYVSYLATYYPWIVAFGAVGFYLAIRRQNPGELGLLAFFITTLAALSSIISFFTNVSGGAPLYERYLTPTIPILFYFASVGILTCLKVVYRSFRTLPRLLPRGQAVKAPLVALTVSLALLGPSVILPSTAMVFPSAIYSSANSTVPWVPFDPFPAHPSALYEIEQPNYALACAYISEHRAPGDVVAAIWPETPMFYLGTVQYWVFSNPPPGAAVDVRGTYEYYLTGATEVSDLSQLEQIMFNTSGWLIVDRNSEGALGGNMTLAVGFLMDLVPAASDDSEALYHWPQLNVTVVLELLESHRPDLQSAFGNNTTALIDWAAVYGVTSPDSRGLLLPIEGDLLGLVTNSTRPLAVLLDVYNHRPDLQAKFPQVVGQENFAGLLHWADEVVSGDISDSAYSSLEPYASYYEKY